MAEGCHLTLQVTLGPPYSPAIFGSCIYDYLFEDSSTFEDFRRGMGFILSATEMLQPAGQEVLVFWFLISMWPE